MKKLILLFAVLGSVINCVAQNNQDEELVLNRIEMYAESLNSPDLNISKEDLLNYGVHLKIRYDDVEECGEEFNIQLFVTQLKEIRKTNHADVQDVRTMLILTFDGKPKKDVYYITPGRKGIIHKDTLYQFHPELYRALYSFMPKSYFDENYFSEEEYKMYQDEDEDEE